MNQRIYTSLFSMRIIGIIGCCAHAGVLDFVDIQQASLINNYTAIHFNTPGNDFQGGMFWLPSIQLTTPATVRYGDKTMSCTRQIRGLYYNSQRGERIWPLDSTTLAGLQSARPEYNSLSISGGRYTTCSGDIYGIYGQITLNDGGALSTLSAGTQMQWLTNTMNNQSSMSLQYFDNKTPIGFLYDSVGGIGFVGGGLVGGYADILALLNSGSSINQLFRYSGSTLLASGSSGLYFLDTASLFQGLNTLFSLGIRGVASFNEEQLSRGNDTQSTIFNQQASVSTVLNAVSQRANALCKGSKIYPRQEFEEARKNNTIVCIHKPEGGYDPGHYVIIDLMDTAQYEGKVFVIKGVNVILRNSMQGNNPTPLILFVDKGNVLFDEQTKQLQDIDTKGFYHPKTSATRGTYLVGTLFINGIIAGFSPEKIVPYTSKLYIHGKLASLNTATTSSVGRTNQLQNLFNNPEGVREDIAPYASIPNAFVRSCNPVTGSGSDNLSSCRDENDQFTSSAFTIIDKPLSSALLP